MSLANAEACPATLAVVSPLAAGQDVLQLGQQMRHVDMLGTEEEARPFALRYRVGQLIHVHWRLARRQRLDLNESHGHL